MLRAAVAAGAVATLGVGLRSWPRGVADLVAAVRFEVRLAEDRPGPDLNAVMVDNTTIYLHQESILTNADIADARVAPGDAANAYSVNLTFNAEGAAKIARTSEAHIGQRLAILIDGAVVMAPVLKAPMSRYAVITGHFTQAEAQRIVDGIRGR